MSEVRNRIAGWAQLLRLPNLFTVPGDVVAGALLAAAAAVSLAPDLRLIAVALASLALYACGLILNDLVDLDLDRFERPQRPLPAGWVPVFSAAAAAVIAAVAGLALAWISGIPTLVVAGLLLIMIAVYNCVAKNHRLAGAFTMGGCRALNLCLGGSLVGFSPAAVSAVLPPALVIGGYIAAVSYIAADETSGRPAGRIRWLPACFGVIAIGLLLHGRAWPSVMVALFATVVYLKIGSAAGRAGTCQPHQIGRWIRGLIGLQAAFCASLPGLGYIAAAILLLLFWPASVLTGRRFHGS